METEQVIEVTGGRAEPDRHAVLHCERRLYSMQGDMADLNRLLQDLWDAIVREPTVDDVARISVHTFSDSAAVEVPLGQASERRSPTFARTRGTNYGAAFRLLADTINRDRQHLKPEGYKIFRPSAFFLSDGEPVDSDSERTVRDTLTYERNSDRGNMDVDGLLEWNGRVRFPLDRATTISSLLGAIGGMGVLRARVAQGSSLKFGA